ncbi:hypothetical protein [Paenibacillus cremeus]|uniref:Lipoprotein n=1 Tax=Paenibacillus cremeus TaxID=2163881 RepID=A0A559KE02_9BACL|nr:hypothetical protein [Paenibacillus cremeus]TVY10362.1 hypothetical protein FPZ49_08145 [Paenibacillus cremeus]
MRKSSCGAAMVTMGGVVLLTGCFSAPSPWVKSQAEAPVSTPAVTAATPAPKATEPPKSEAAVSASTTPSKEDAPAKPIPEELAQTAPAASSAPPVKEEAAPAPKPTPTPAAAESPAPQAPQQKPEPAPEVTVEQVTAKYRAELTQLKAYYSGQLQDLYGQAVAAQKSGQSNRDILTAFSQKVVALEEDSQAKVNEALFKMKEELTSHNLPLDSVDELRTSYYAELDKAKASFMDKAKIDFKL